MALKRPNLRWNAASNVVATIANAAVVFFVTPAIISHLGERRFGMWTLASSLIGYFSILRFGVGSAVFRYVPHFRGAGDKQRVNSVASTCMVFYLVIACLILVTMVIVATPVATFFGGDQEFVSLVRVIGIAAALELPAIVYSTLLQSYEFFFVANAVAVVRALIQRTSLLWCVRAGYGLVGMGLTQAAVAFFCLVVQGIGVHFCCRELHLSLRNVRVADLRLLLSFGILVLWASGANFIVTESPKQIVGKVISLEALAGFGVAVLLISYYRGMFLSLTRILRPRFAYLSGNNARGEIRELFLKSSRYAAILATCAAVILCVVGPTFLVLWTKKRSFEAAGIPLVVMAIGNVVFLSNNVANDLLFGLGLQRKIAEFESLEAVMILLLTLGMARYWGVIGAAVGASFPLLAVRGFVQPWYTCRLVGVRFRDYYGRCVVPVWLVGMLVGGSLCLPGVRGHVPSWGRLVSMAACACVAYVVGTYFMAVSKEERKQLKDYVGSKLLYGLGLRRCGIGHE